MSEAIKTKAQDIHTTICSAAKNLLASAGDVGDVGSIPGSGRSSAGGNGNPLQYSCLKNSSDRGSWWASTHGFAKSRSQLSMHARTILNM